MIFIYPTDTAYALGCDARDEKAVKKIFEIKSRDKLKTLPLIASSIEMVFNWCEFSDIALEIAKKYWPGPLTLVLPVKKKIDSIASLSTASLQNDKLSLLVIKDGCVAIRVPDSEEARNLSKKLASPIVSTSANKAGDNNLYSIKEVKKSLGDKFDLVDKIIDKGELEEKIPSTIIQIQNNKIKILRKGQIQI